MNAAALLDMIQAPDLRIQGHTVVVNNEPHGILVPSVLIAGPDANGRLRVLGPKRTAECQADDSREVWHALITAGSLLFGTPEDIAAVDALLMATASRRMAAWLCPILRDCSEVRHAMRRVRDADVVQLGAGSIGSLVGMALASAGIGRLTVVDEARLTGTDLDRHYVYGSADVGRSKAVLLRERVAARYPHTAVEAMDRRVDVPALEGLVEGADVLVIAIGQPGLFVERAAQVARRLGAVPITCSPAAPGLAEWMRLPHAVSERNGAITVALAGHASESVLKSLAGLEADSKE